MKSAIGALCIAVAICPTLHSIKINVETIERKPNPHAIDTQKYAQQKAIARNTPKIVGLVPVRNEAAYIDQCLRALACYTDAIVVLDDASTDTTIEIVQALAKSCAIERIITKKTWHRDEPGDRNKLLQAGRSIGGTHFIVIDADEMLTAPCLKNNYLRTKILAMQPGQQMRLNWITLWGSLNTFRADRLYIKNCIFCDDGISYYTSNFIHTFRVPENLSLPEKNPEVIDLDDHLSYGLLHFEAANPINMLIKRAWYKCLERIRTKVPAREINKKYFSQLPKPPLAQSHANWFAYNFFDARPYNAQETWRTKQVKHWFNQYGRDYFADLTIWHIDWDAGIAI